jgi:hypothetical protein
MSPEPSHATRGLVTRRISGGYIMTRSISSGSIAPQYPARLSGSDEKMVGDDGLEPPTFSV